MWFGYIVNLVIFQTRYVFFMVGGFVYGLGITVKTFLSLFQHCELSHFHPLYIDSGYLL